MGTDRAVFVTGATGQVGRALRSLAPEFTYLSREELDLECTEDIHRTLGGSDVIVHLGAMTDVDGCEREPDRAWHVNALSTEAIASLGRRVIYISTDYVFDGMKGSPYTESDEPSPLNAYGRSKLHGERCVLAAATSLVIRTSWIYGQGRNFIRTILAAAAKTDRLTVVDDQVGRPTSAVAVALAVLQAVTSHVLGIVHLTGDGPPCSWADLAAYSIRCAGLDTLVDKVSTEQYSRVSGRPLAARPNYSVLALNRADALGWSPMDWRDSVKSYVTDGS